MSTVVQAESPLGLAVACFSHTVFARWILKVWSWGKMMDIYLSFIDDVRRNAMCCFSSQRFWEVMCSWSAPLCLSRHCYSEVPEDIPTAAADLHFKVQCKSFLFRITFFPLYHEVPWVLQLRSFCDFLEFTLKIMNIYWIIISGNYVHFCASWGHLEFCLFLV